MTKKMTKKLTDKKIASIKRSDPRFDPHCEMCLLNYGFLTLQEVTGNK